MNTRLKVAVLSSFGLMIASGASAVTVTPSSDAANLVTSILAPSSGITVVAGSEGLIGADTQQGTYSDFSLSSAQPGKPTFALPNGAVLTSGSAGFSTTENTVNDFSVNSGTGSYAPLVTLAGDNGLSTTQFNANVLSFDFTVADPTLNGVTGQFLFATDEFPTQSVTDILGIFVNGINYAFFPDGSLVTNQPGNAGGFFTNNEVGDTDYPIEWNGLTKAYTFEGLLKPGVNTFALAISDTQDSIFDSAVFFSSFRAATIDGGGGIIDPDPVPLPAAGWLMLAGLAGLGLLRRRSRTV